MSEAPIRSSKSLPAELAVTLRDRIADGEWPAGARLPSEQELAARFGVSRPTVRAALRSLADTGTVRVRRGTGTFVSPHSSAIRASMQPLRSTSELIREQGHDCDVTFRVKALRTATAREAEQLQREKAPIVLAYERSFTSDRTAIAFEKGTLAVDVFPLGTDFDDLTSSIFDFLEPLGLRPDQALTKIQATYNHEIAWGPHKPDPPLYLTLEQVQFLPSNTALSWSITHFVQENFQFHLVRSV
ncbi:GntR family transcriptional regulator [Arthrobacter castelli]|uniref:GntR family transcriptional regulator n=1 Tax=Arthrobacter castelli TaxID=271431 RepID=UPI0004153F62|nr:GntR family transcriptional regulator [Arthrobacter castelli]